MSFNPLTTTSRLVKKKVIPFIEPIRYIVTNMVSFKENGVKDFRRAAVIGNSNEQIE